MLHVIILGGFGFGFDCVGSDKVQVLVGTMNKKYKSFVHLSSSTVNFISKHHREWLTILLFLSHHSLRQLICYFLPDVTTAAVAKEALEGHCIYDGGYCKLHLSYSRHTDLNVKV